MNWILAKEDEENTRRIAEAAGRAGHRVVELDRQAYAFGAQPLLPHDLRGPVIAYGDTSMVQRIQHHARHGSGWAPVAWAPWDQLRCGAYLGWIGSLSVQKHRALVRVKDLLGRMERIYDEFSADGCVFIRPDANDKSFPGSIVEAERFEAWAAPILANQGPYALCLVARPAWILREWRCVVVGDRVVTSSLYKEEGRVRAERGCPAEASRVALLAKEWWGEAPAACVVDVADTGEGFYVVEVGPVNCAGLYGCDAGLFVRELSDLAARDASV